MLTDIIGNYHRDYQLQRQRVGFHCVFLGGGLYWGRTKVKIKLLRSASSDTSEALNSQYEKGILAVTRGG